MLWSLGYAELEAGADAAATWEAILQHPQANDLMRATTYFLLNRKNESLAAFRAHSDLLVGEPSIRLLYARLLREMDLDAEARAEFEALRDLGPGLPEPIVSAADRAFVSYALGDYATALDLLKPALDAGPECSYTPTDVAGVAMLCHLAQGDVMQAVVARDGLLATLRNAYDGDEVVAELARLGSGPELTPEVTAEITESAARIRAAVTRISEIGLDLDVALENLRHMIDDGVRGPLAETQAAVAALTSSRLLLRQARWADAGHACVALLTGGTTAVTEEPACVDAVTDRLFAAADQLIRGGTSDAGLSLLEQALPGIRPGRRHEVLLRMVLVNLADGRPDAAQKFAAEIQDVGEPTVASVLQAIAPDVEAIYRIAARAEQAHLPGLDQALLRIAEDVLDLNHAESDERTVSPILIEIGEGLLTEDPPADGPLFRTQLPGLRDRVCQQTGVWLPGVLIRVVPDLPTDRFRVSVAGQWPDLGELRPGMVYVRRTKRRVVNALGSTAQVIPVTDPVSGKEACWVRYEQPPLLGRLSAWWKGTSAQSASPAEWKDFIADTDTWDDPLCYPLAVLERYVIARLSYLVTADETAAAAERWRQGGGIDLDSPVIEAGLGRLTLLGHDLLDEGFALIPRPGSGAELERILNQDVPYPAALAAARDIFTSPLPGEGK